MGKKKGPLKKKTLTEIFLRMIYWKSSSVDCAAAESFLLFQSSHEKRPPSSKKSPSLGRNEVKTFYLASPVPVCGKVLPPTGCNKSAAPQRARDGHSILRLINCFPSAGFPQQWPLLQPPACPPSTPLCVKNKLGSLREQPRNQTCWLFVHVSVMRVPEAQRASVLHFLFGVMTSEQTRSQ